MTAMNQAVDLLKRVYGHVGNHTPAQCRHKLPPGLRDDIRDFLTVCHDVPLSAWSAEPPTREGWYWHRNSSMNEYIVRINSEGLASLDDNSLIDPIYMGGFWQPVERPKP